jgi:hypothetical protein
MLPRCGTARHATFVMLLGDEHHPLLFNRVGAEREMNVFPSSSVLSNPTNQVSLKF